MRATLADTYAGIGRRDLAQPQRERSLELLRQTLGEGHERTQASFNRYVVNTTELGRMDEAQALSEDALETAAGRAVDLRDFLVATHTVEEDKVVRALADEVCGGRLAFVLEGVVTQQLIPKHRSKGRCLAAELFELRHPLLASLQVHVGHDHMGPGLGQPGTEGEAQFAGSGNQF